MVKIAVLYRTMVSDERDRDVAAGVSRWKNDHHVGRSGRGAAAMRSASAARGTPAGGPRTAEDPIPVVDHRRAAAGRAPRLEPRGGLRAAAQEWSTLNDLPIKSAGGGGGSLRRGLERIASMALGLHA